MNSLLVDLTEDIETYEKYQIPENSLHQKNINGLIELLLKNQVEDIEKELSAVFQVENFTPTSSTYNSMKSAGKLHLIEDLTLRKNLSDYYEGLVLESKKKGEFQAEYFTKELMSWLTGNVDLVEMKLLTADNLIELRNKLIIYESLIGQKVDSYKQVVEDSRNLKSGIEAIMKSE